mmetsp:Transcript_19464/g.26917  ORF Transcript_19464/g.26917 Transcript_19464/m.26917 type:complete len:464 (-) Transcript_19464:102-1493(-)
MTRLSTTSEKVNASSTLPSLTTSSTPKQSTGSSPSSVCFSFWALSLQCSWSRRRNRTTGSPRTTFCRNSYRTRTTSSRSRWRIQSAKSGLFGDSRWDQEDRGTLYYDTSFSLSERASQESLIETCRLLKTAECSASKCGNGMLARYGEVKCFMEGFGAWLATFNEILPLSPPQHFTDRLFSYSNSEEAKFNYTNMVGFVLDPECSGPDCVTDEQGRMFGLKFARMMANSTFEDPLPFKNTDPIYDEWEKFVKTRNEASPEALNKAFQVSYTWNSADTQRALVAIVMSGMGITFALAFVVLIVATGNLVLALISIVTIAGIVLTVLGVGAKLIMGWSLDVTESISAVILIGLSVDYCVHLAHAYKESPSSKRGDRMRDALTTMGISVTAGAVTTFLAGAFLFGAVLPFFNKFGFIVVFTVISSYCWSMFFFTAACAAIGPEDEFGDVMPMLKWVYAKLSDKAAK